MTVSTLSGKVNNLEYTNGLGSNSTYIFPLGCVTDSKGNVVGNQKGNQIKTPLVLSNSGMNDH